ncbi:MAG: DUF6709 family protein [Aristaeellaceae bacterium]
MKKYLRPRMGNLIPFAGFVLAGLMCLHVGIEGMMQKGFDVRSLLIASAALLLCVGMGALISRQTVLELKRWKKFMQALQTSTDAEQMLKDFEEGAQLLNDSLRMGERYVAGKRGVIMYRYEEITRVYEYVHKTNGGVDTHELRIVDKEGITRILCKLPMRCSQEDMTRMFLFMKLRNKQIICGYSR